MDLGLVVARALHFWACAILFGGAGLALALRRRQRAVILVLRVAAALASLSGVAWFAEVFVGVTGGIGGFVDRDMWSAFLDAPFGPPWAVRLGLCLAAAGIALKRAPPTFLVLGAGFVVDQAWLGHAATGVGADAITEILVYWVHVLAGFAWVGALLMLCVVSADERRVPRDGLAVFASIGPFIVAAIVASGLVNASFRGIGPAGLVTTAYGRILAVKLALFAAMVALAVRNRFSADNTSDRSIAAETLFGLAVLAVAALLGVTAPG